MYIYTYIYIVYLLDINNIPISCRDIQVFGYRRGGEVRPHRAALGALPGSSRGGSRGLLPAHGLLGRAIHQDYMGIIHRLYLDYLIISYIIDYP